MKCVGGDQPAEVDVDDKARLADWTAAQ